jgi:predicted acyltransferase
LPEGLKINRSKILQTLTMKQSRLRSLDVFRGVTVAAMILVNNPGSWSSVYPPLLHAEWNGCTPTDLIFPFFLFIVGVSIHFSYQHKIQEGLSSSLMLKIVKRALLIFFIGFLLNLIPKFDFEAVRIPGVLQRIGIVFFVASILYLKTSWITQLRVGISLLILYYILMIYFSDVPTLEPETNPAAALDRFFLSGHLWVQSKTWDPEGILSTLPAIVTAIIGMLAGQTFSKIEEPAERTTWLFLIGAILIALGLAWGLVFPINKSLWTSSYVLYTGGIAMQFLAVCYWLIDVKGYGRYSKVFEYFGTNALFVFVLSGLLAKFLIRTKINEVSLWSLFYKSAYASWMEPKIASLCFALTLIFIFFLLVRWLYKRNVFIRL